MTEKQKAPYGSWKSPITSDLIVAGTIGLGEIALDGRKAAEASSSAGRPMELLRTSLRQDSMRAVRSTNTEAAPTSSTPAQSTFPTLGIGGSIVRRRVKRRGQSLRQRRCAMPTA